MIVRPAVIEGQQQGPGRQWNPRGVGRARDPQAIPRNSDRARKSRHCSKNRSERVYSGSQVFQRASAGDKHPMKCDDRQRPPIAQPVVQRQRTAGEQNFKERAASSCRAQPVLLPGISTRQSVPISTMSSPPAFSSETPRGTVTRQAALPGRCEPRYVAMRPGRAVPASMGSCCRSSVPPSRPSTTSVLLAPGGSAIVRRAPSCSIASPWGARSAR